MNFEILLLLQRMGSDGNSAGLFFSIGGVISLIAVYRIFFGAPDDSKQMKINEKNKKHSRNISEYKQSHYDLDQH